MAVIQPILVDKMFIFLDDVLAKAKVKMNGEYKEYQTLKTVRDGQVMRKYIYLETEEGLIEEAQLLSSTGDILAVKPFKIDKDDNGLVLAFVFTLLVQEG